MTIVFSDFWFGDVFSLRGETDLYRCIIAGRTIENSNAGNSELNDAITTTSPPISGVGINGIYMARTWGGGGTSIKVNLIGDYSLVSTNANNTQLPMNSILQMPNGPDGSVYLAPLRVFESGFFIRNYYYITNYYRNLLRFTL